ncbi:short chain dehydrogenase [Saitoella complicata NRRL Y-17804]|uniref:Ketoreductase (KR) domain-containing protein n=1 Tax=Saitoella complicata (strain BCRC 22490 / CBS 7301 / JCM 7358 / NBRC 10748 / NRRL Y-17804) TaxID=698492 RepID=A0A0E9NRU4_SAICN|nr:short chain dehydrogenase [Saitoella complicata NRRL Y-17804]ODQ55550.1 short chain dehydrogenase [Saitoella complicata NRRL Y-17804]GAO52597.1 hypothetical protein G7K_6670-t1 [Saitoella complicata NRRL Y-17804]
MSYKLKGRNVLVTASSNGLGAEVARQFAAAGCNVAINFHSSPDAANTVVDACKAENISSIAIQADLSSKDDCERLVKEAKEQLGGLDVVVSNGGWTKFAPFEDLEAFSDEEWDKCWTMNVKSHFWLFRAAKPFLEANEDGGVFLISSSLAALKPSGSSLPYSTTKSASLHLTKCLATTSTRIRVNAVLPGLLLTQWGQKFGEEKIREIAERAQLKQVTEVEDAAQMFVGLAANGGITGQGVCVDSGIGFK